MQGVGVFYWNPSLSRSSCQSHTHPPSATWSALFLETGFIKVCFLCVSRQHPPPKQPRGKCSDSPIFESCRQLFTRSPKPLLGPCLKLPWSTAIFWGQCFTSANILKRMRAADPTSQWKNRSKCSEDAPKDQIDGSAADFIRMCQNFEQGLNLMLMKVKLHNVSFTASCLLARSGFSKLASFIWFLTFPQLPLYTFILGPNFPKSSGCT